MDVSTEAAGRSPEKRIELPRRLDVAICEYLSEEIRAAHGKALKLHAGEVELLGAGALQLLVSAQRQWAADGVAFTVEAPSEAFSDGLRLLGYPRSPFEEGQAA